MLKPLLAVVISEIFWMCYLQTISVREQKIEVKDSLTSLKGEILQKGTKSQADIPIMVFLIETGCAEGWFPVGLWLSVWPVGQQSILGQLKLLSAPPLLRRRVSNRRTHWGERTAPRAGFYMVVNDEWLWCLLVVSQRTSHLLGKMSFRISEIFIICLNCYSFLFSLYQTQINWLRRYEWASNMRRQKEGMCISY